jgi:class 3 adenylate cyclase
LICSTCAAENKPGRRFCLECGAPLEIVCPSCGAANEPAAKFCGSCASPLAAPGPGQPATATAPVVAERRLVSVLFADLVGFTPYAEKRDAEDVRETLDRYFAQASQVIGRYGGTVEKFIGDAVMAVWGAPTAHEDDAERAVRAALELVDAVRQLGPGIQARAGVLTGEAAVTVGATNQGLVAGDIVNTASRLQSAAEPGTVLVGEATRLAADKAIVFEPAGERTLKGKDAPVAAWRAVRVVAERGGRNRTETLEAPFVGRDDELRLLKDLFHATAREGRARLVSVIGPAGIGKTRLAWEFLKYVDGLVEPDVWWHDGRSPAYGDGISFWALGEMVRGRAQLAEGDDEATTRTKIAALMARHIADEDERRWVEAALLTLLGVDAGAPSDELFAAWRTFFERLAATAPVVLVFEDFHFADTGLLDFVDHLLEWARNAPIYVLTLARPDLIDKRPDWGAGKRNFVSLALDPLGPEAMRALLEGLVPGLPEAAVESIVARADGIPLYAVETVRMLLARGQLTVVDGTYRPTGNLATLDVPETLVALIASRLDALPPEERAVVADAAVLGQSFTAEGLAAVAGASRSALEPRLRALVRRELMRVEANPRSPEHGNYTFVQALIREVAYGTLARPERKVRHLAAARWFEALGDEELAGALAGHYVAALRNSAEGPEADALATQARLTLRGAADRAGSLGSHAQELGFLEQALMLASDPADRAALQERAAAAAHQAARTDVAAFHLDAAQAWYHAQGDQEGVVRVALAQGRLLIDQGQPASAIRAMEVSDAEGPGATSARAYPALLAELSRAYSFTDDPRALETADRALALAEAREIPAGVAEALINRALALSMAHRTAEPEALLRGVIHYADRHGLSRSSMRAINNLASGIFLDDPREAAELARQGAELAGRLGDRGWLLTFTDGRASELTVVGDWDEALRLEHEVESLDLPPGAAVSIAEDIAFLEALRGDAEQARARLTAVEPIRLLLEDSRGEGTRLLVETQVLALEGRLVEAYDAAMNGARRTDPAVFPNSLWAARIAIWLGDPERARVALELNRAFPVQGRFVEANRRTIEAGVMAMDGDVDGALAAYREAERLCRALDLPFLLSMSLMECGTLLDPAIPAVAAAAVEARAVMERLGSPPLLARLEAMLEAQAERFGGQRPRGPHPSATAADPATHERSSSRP